MVLIPLVGEQPWHRAEERFAQGYTEDPEEQGLEPAFPHSFSGSVREQDDFSPSTLQGSSSDPGLTFHSVAVRYSIFCKFV